MDKIGNIIGGAIERINTNIAIKEKAELQVIEGKISIYTGKAADKIDVIRKVNEISEIFPKIGDAKLRILTSYFIKNNFTLQRINDSIDKVATTCIYPEPQLAEFLSFDKSIKTYKYSDILKELEYNKEAFKEFKAVRLTEQQTRPVYVLTADFENYNLTEFKKI